MTPSDIEQIIDKYGRPVWEAAQYQVRVEIITDLVWAVVLLLPISLLIFKAIPWLVRGRKAEQQKSYGDEMEYTMGIGAAGLAVTILATIWVFNLNEIIGDVINPTWAALRIILGAVGKG